jgi:hypothetical protein
MKNTLAENMLRFGHLLVEYISKVLKNKRVMIKTQYRIRKEQPNYVIHIYIKELEQLVIQILVRF